MLITTGTVALTMAVALVIDSLIHRRQLRELRERLEQVERTLATDARSRSTARGAY